MIQMQVANPDGVKIHPIKVLLRHSMRARQHRNQAASSRWPFLTKTPRRRAEDGESEVPEPRTTSFMQERLK
jgi:hypothetical protein